MEKPFSNENLMSFYTGKLEKKNISSKEELEKALKKKEVDLELNLDGFVAPEKREEILKNNPDEIEVAGKMYGVNYEYDKYGEEGKKFSADIKIPAQEIFNLKEIPKLPSGREILLKIVSKEGETYTKFSGYDLEKLKQKSKEFLIEKQWDKWRDNKDSPKRQKLEEFNLLEKLPELSQPIQYGIDPETKEPLFAYPAFEVYKYSDGNVFYTDYFISMEESQKAQTQVDELINKAKEEKQKADEKEKLLAPARELLEKVKSDFEKIEDSYRNYGLSYDERDGIKNKLRQAENKLEEETKEALEILENIQQRSEEALEYNEKRKECEKKAEDAIIEHYSKCPLCGKELYPREYECTDKNHNLELIDFEVDEEGYEDTTTLLSRIVTDEGKIIAQMCCSSGVYDDYISIESGRDLDEENRWKGELFENIKFEDFGKILDSEKAKERKEKIEQIVEERESKEKREQYQQDFEYALENVEKGYLEKGKFKKGLHPKTNEEQWEMDIMKDGTKIKYIVDKYERQPTSEDLEYFFSEGKFLVDTPKFKLIIINLEYPFPEDKPAQDEESVKSSLEDLKKAWGAK